MMLGKPITLKDMESVVSEHLNLISIVNDVNFSSGEIIKANTSSKNCVMVNKVRAVRIWEPHLSLLSQVVIYVCQETDY